MKYLLVVFLFLFSSAYAQSLPCIASVGCENSLSASGIDSQYAIMPSPSDTLPEVILCYRLDRLYKQGEILRVRVSGIIPEGSNVQVCTNLWEGYDSTLNFGHTKSILNIQDDRFFLTAPRSKYDTYAITSVCVADTKYLILLRQNFHNNYKLNNGKLTGGEIGWQNGLDALIDDVCVWQPVVDRITWKYLYGVFQINSSIIGKTISK